MSDLYIENEEEMLEMWIEKLNRPSRIALRGGKEMTIEEVKDFINEENKSERILALGEINAMNSKEFQDRLLADTLPEFVREEVPEYPKLDRDTCHPFSLMREKDHEGKCFNQGYLNRDKLRYYSVKDFKSSYYQEFFEIIK